MNARVRLPWRPTKDIAADIRKELKALAPWKFSVTISRFSGGSSIEVALISGPEEPIEGFIQSQLGVILPDTAIVKGHARYAQLNKWQLLRPKLSIRERLSNGYILTPAGWKAMAKAAKIVDAHHWDESDIQSDHHSCNFYYSLNIGKWNRDFIVTP